MDDQDLTACAEIVRRGDPDRFRATMAAPVAARRVLFPLYAFNVEVARAPWVTQEHMIAEMRLQWWRDALAEIAAGGLVRRHEVVTPLAMVLDKTSAEELDQLILARRWDIYREPFEDEAAFRQHLDHTSGHLLRAALRALGQEPVDWVADAGFAQGLAAWLRAIPALEAAGRVPLVDGRPEAIRTLAQEALTRLGTLPAPNPKTRPALLALWPTRTVLKAVVNDPGLVASGGLEPGPIRGTLALARAALTGRI